MQVKKFEARTMKEALEMVKSQMGPDAIILSARDNNKSFGLVGEGSVEITAAISEETLQKKKFAESRLREEDRLKFQQSSARQQKELIQKMVQRHTQKNQAPPAVTQRRYIEIEDEAEAERARQAQQQQMQQQRAAAAVVSIASRPAPPVVAPPVESPEVLALKNEIASLRQVINQFQQIPQNFVGTHPGAAYGINYDLSAVYEKLTQAGVAEEIAAEILTQAQEILPPMKQKNRALVEAWVARHVLDTTLVSKTPTQGKIHCFVGPAGSGKTSTLIKMASHMVVREGKKIALFTTDTFKVGAADQMKIYAQILNVPFSVIRTQQDWSNLVRYLANVDCVLVDYTGSNLKNSHELQMLKSLLPPAALTPQIHLCLSTNAKDSDATELGRRYTALNYKDVIFTSLDESTQHGSIYNFMKRFNVPLHSFGIGPRVPEDFEFATKERLLDLIFKITKIKQNEAEAI